MTDGHFPTIIFLNSYTSTGAIYNILSVDVSGIVSILQKLKT